MKRLFVCLVLLFVSGISFGMEKEHAQISSNNTSSSSNSNNNDSWGQWFTNVLVRIRYGRVTQEALMRACCYDDIDFIEYAVKTNPDIINEKDSDTGNRALHWACDWGNDETVKLLLSYENINVNALCHYGIAALHEACMHHQEAKIKLLLMHKGISINTKDLWRGNTALHYACLVPEEKVIKVLLAYKDTDIDAQNNMGNTALHSACQRKYYPKEVKLLLKYNAYTGATNNDGETPKDLAIDQAIIDLFPSYDDDEDK